MNRTAHVVIGANYGDEGKGLATDYLCSLIGAEVVVRFNGGAQAGHTVVTPQGQRHVFQHFGSGTFLGVPTYLSKFFVCNPVLFVKELRALSRMKVRSTVFVDRRCPITTPYEMLLNQAIEKQRGSARHGSCGVGFGETIERQERGPHFTVQDLVGHPIEPRLRSVREYALARAALLGLNDKAVQYIASYPMDGFLADVNTFLSEVELGGMGLLVGRRRVVFEGAQGLMLDQDGSDFPHVTRSHTGLNNVLEMAEASGINTLDVYYMTRTYLTRHGAGPLPAEVDSKTWKSIKDYTNVQHEFQQALRFAPLDTARLARSISMDVRKAVGTGIVVQPNLFVTWCDVAASVLPGASGSQYIYRELSIYRETGMDGKCLGSYGPRRIDVVSGPSKTHSVVGSAVQTSY